jgi:hypothetical protein
VLLEICAEPNATRTPDPPTKRMTSALLPEMVLSLIVSEALTAATPPPEKAVFPETVLPVIVAEPSSMNTPPPM